ncbi:MAG: Wzy polymerase domain-containing protein [Sulfuritalea sp.]|nr:Wzy polymerase domain-containing protein [Sulfuritalea sp.]
MAFPVNGERLAAFWRRLSAVAPFREVDLAALLLFLALLLPFVLSYHRNPIPSFYQEWVAIFLAVTASILVAAKYRGEPFALPFSAWIPLTLLPAVAFHLTAGNDQIVHGPPLLLIYIGSAVLLMIVGRKLGSAWQAVSLADVMAAALVTGALAAAVASWHWRFGTAILEPLPWGPAAGWIAQRNQNALHIWLGVLGLSHFFLNRKISWMLFLGGLAILAETASFTGSRSVYMYATGGLLLGLWAAAKSAPREVRVRLLLIAICPVMWLGILQATHALTDRDSGGDPPVATDAIPRYAPATVMQDPRTGLWFTAAQIMLAKPWAGSGPGSFIRDSWLLSDGLPEAIPTTIPATHAHNLFFQIGAELGAPTALILAGLISIWLAIALRQTNWVKTWLLVAIPAVILTHNQVEYSLWYLYFLVPGALAMGAAIERDGATRLPASGVLVTALLALALAAQLGQDYKTVEAVVANARSGRGEIAPLLAAAAHPVFGAWASTEIAGNAWTTGISRQEQGAHARRALFVSPVNKAALLLHLETLNADGMRAEATTEKRILERVFGSN